MAGFRRPASVPCGLLHSSVTSLRGRKSLSWFNTDKGDLMATNALKFTTHEGVAKTVPLDTVRVIKRLTDEDKAKAKASLKEKRGIDIDTARVSIRIEFGEWNFYPDT